MQAALFSPLFMVFEVVQLLIAQRYIGLVQIRLGVHPLTDHPRAPLWLTVPWLVGLAADYAYQVSLLVNQPKLVRLAGILMLLVSVAGFGFRRICGLKWGLVVLTLEGATRAGFMGYVFIARLRHPEWFALDAV